MNTVKPILGCALALRLITVWGQAEICPECETTARITLQSALAEARGDYYLSVARGTLIADEDDREEFLEEARTEYREAVSESRDVHEARLDLCDRLEECVYTPNTDPENFVSPAEAAANPNPYWPMVPGTSFVYESETDEGLETIRVTITDETKEILGIDCVVVRDTVWLEDEVIEDTQDWYAQDKEGNVWYMGEFTEEFEDGEFVGIEGSWEAGEDGALPGIAMWSNPVVGTAYRQELLLGEAEDAGVILALGVSAEVPFGSFTDCVQTLDLNPHDPGLIEHKFYAPGVGFVYEVKPESGEEVVLVAIERP